MTIFLAVGILGGICSRFYSLRDFHPNNKTYNYSFLCNAGLARALILE